MHSFNPTEIDGGAKVFESYGFELPINQKRKQQKENPLRNDEKVTSLFVFDNGQKGYYFQDFASDEKGNWFDVIEKLDTSASTKQDVFRIAKEIYNYQYQPVKKVFKKSPKKPKKALSKRELLASNFSNFSKQDLEFWKDKTGANQDILEKVGIKPLKLFIEKKESGKVYKNEGLEFVYHFEGGKLYAPKKEQRFNRNSKSYWLPQNQKDSYWFGYVDYPNKPIILCEGESDAVCLIAHGFNAFTVGGVTSKVPKNAPKFDFILYDNDEAGIKASQKIARESKAKVINLNGAKDVCEYFSKFGSEKIKEEITYQIEKIRGSKIKGYGKYITDKNKQNKALFEAIKRLKRVNIKAFTGAGKTTAIESIANFLGRRAIVFVPKQDTCLEFDKEKYIRVLEGVTKKEIEAFTTLHPNKSIVCVYDSLPKILPVLDDENDCFFIDELHTFSNLDYRNEAIESLFQFQKNLSFVVGLSGTPQQNEILQERFDLHPINVLTKRDKRLKIYRLLGKDSANQKAKKLIDTKHKANHIFLIQQDDKAKNKALRDCFPHLNIWLIDNDNYDALKETKEFQDWKKTGYLPSDLDGIICTSKVRESVNILNTNISFTASLNCNDAKDEFQFIERPRQLLEQTHYSIKTSNNKHTNYNEYYEIIKELEKAEKAKKELEKIACMNGSLELIAKNQKNEIFENYRSKYAENEIFLDSNLNINETAIHQTVRSKKNELQGTKQYYEELTSFAPNIELSEINLEELSKEEKKTLKEKNKAVKEEIQKVRGTILKKAKENLEDLFLTISLLTKNRKLKSLIQSVFNFEHENKFFDKEIQELYKTNVKTIESLCYSLAFLFKIIGKDSHIKIIDFVMTMSNQKLNIYIQAVKIFLDCYFVEAVEKGIIQITNVRKLKDAENTHNRHSKLLDFFGAKESFNLQDVLSKVNSTIYHQCNHLGKNSIKIFLDVYFYNQISYCKKKKKYQFSNNEFDEKEPFKSLPFYSEIVANMQRCVSSYDEEKSRTDVQQKMTKNSLESAFKGIFEEPVYDFKNSVFL